MIQRDTDRSMAGCKILHQVICWGLSVLRMGMQRQSQQIEGPRMAAFTGRQ